MPKELRAELNERFADLIGGLWPEPGARRAAPAIPRAGSSLPAGGRPLRRAHDAAPPARLRAHRRGRIPCAGAQRRPGGAEPARACGRRFGREDDAAVGLGSISPRRSSCRGSSPRAGGGGGRAEVAGIGRRGRSGRAASASSCARDRGAHAQGDADGEGPSAALLAARRGCSGALRARRRRARACRGMVRDHLGPANPLPLGGDAGAVEHAFEHARLAGSARWEGELPAWRGTAMFYGPTPVDEALRWYEEQRAQHPIALTQQAMLEAMRGDFDRARVLAGSQKLPQRSLVRSSGSPRGAWPWGRSRRSPATRPRPSARSAEAASCWRNSAMPATA